MLQLPKEMILSRCFKPHTEITQEMRPAFCHGIGSEFLSVMTQNESLIKDERVQQIEV